MNIMTAISCGKYGHVVDVKIDISAPDRRKFNLSESYTKHSEVFFIVSTYFAPLSKDMAE